MKDPVLESYLKDFSEEFKKNDAAPSEQFEHFVNFCTLSKHYAETFDPDDVSIGGSGDLGIDGLGIFVNDHLVLDENDIEYHKKNLRRFDVKFVFIQAKLSRSFDGGEIGTFFSGIRNFFNERLPSTANAKIRMMFNLKNCIYRNTVHMDYSPIVIIYYATTGSWKDDASLLSRVNQGKNDLTATDLFSKVEFHPMDAERCKRTYRELKNKFVRELTFEKHTILPEIKGVKEAYIGIVPATEYLKILCDEDGILNRRLFYDNVRDFQGHNAVNLEIRATIQEPSQRDRFSLLNNGVTVVAKDVNKVGAKFRLRDYQVVNGCQTSHVIFMAQEYLSDQIYLPFKLIVTNDVEVTNKIIQGANRQTEIKPEAFESLTPFQKELEENYAAVSKLLKVPAHYERRSKQYDDAPIGRDKIISMPTQIKCFVGMFLNEPHSTHRYYGELLEAYRNRIFAENHRFLPYVVSGVAYLNLERLFANGTIQKTLRNYRFQMLMAFRLRYGLGEMPALSNKNIDDYCGHLLARINIASDFADGMKDVGKTILEAEKNTDPRKELPVRTRSFTQSIITRVTGEETKIQDPTNRSLGNVSEFNSHTNSGYISSREHRKRVKFERDGIDT